MLICDAIPNIRPHSIRKITLDPQGPLNAKNQFQWSNGNYDSAKAISRLLPDTLIEIDLIDRKLTFLNGEEHSNVIIPG